MSSVATLPLCFSEQDFSEIKEAFDALDSDEDGAVTVDQICKAMEQLGLPAFRQEIV